MADFARAGNTLLDLAEVAHCDYTPDPADPANDQLYVTLRSAMSGWTIVGAHARTLFERLAARGQDAPAPTTPSVAAETAGDGVVLRPPGTSAALVLYGENRTGLNAVWDSPGVPTNVFFLGLDPKKTWRLVIDGQRVAMTPNNVGYAQTWVDKGRHALSLEAIAP